jgi:phosphohistidine phosphatase SixA
MIFLVRHAHAGDKHRWAGSDKVRPLSAAGRQEAAGLVRQLLGRPIDAIVSSPALRCVQTVDRLARQHELGIAIDQRLARDADMPDTIALLDELEGMHAVLCAHGENIGALLAALRSRGASIPTDAEYAKGSTWLLDTVGGAPISAQYLPPLRLDHAGARPI